jgi:VWFA-related protein
LIRSRLVLAAGILAIAGAALAQQPEAEMPTFMESVDVRVINIDVVVTDRKGTPVRGLKMSDFEIFENGRPMAVTNFYEVTPSGARGMVTNDPTAPQAAPAPAPEVEEVPPANLRRRIILFIDNLSLQPFNRNRVFESMKEFVKTTMRPGDEAMIATWNRSMKIRVPFTSDQTQILQMLEGIAGESALGVHALSERRQAESQIRDARTYSDAIATARQYAQSIDHDLRQSVSAINGLMGTLAGVEGKKILVLTSEGFPMSPGKEMFFFIDDIARDKRQWGSHGSSLIESMGFDASNVIQSIARTANANNITLYTLHAAGLAGYNEGSAEHSKPVSLAASQAALSNSTDSMNLLANMTGGVATTGTNNFKMGFERMKSDLDSYYSLGYRAGTERVDRQRPVEVRTKNRNYVVRYRRTFVEKSIQTEMNDRVIANLFYDSTANDMKITVITKQPTPTDEGLFKVPLEVHVPMESITLFPQGETHVGGFTVYVAASDKNGDMSDVSNHTQTVRVPNGEIETIAGKHFTYEVELLMNKGRNRISVGVVDDISKQTGFERQEVLAMDLR